MCLTVKPEAPHFPLEYEVYGRGHEVHVSFPYLLWDPRAESPTDGIDFSFREICTIYNSMIDAIEKDLMEEGSQ